MTFSERLSKFLKIRYLVAAICILAGAGAGYKYAPTVWHKGEDKAAVKTLAKAASSTDTQPVFGGTVATNSDGTKLSSCDLGTVNLTNHQETCVTLGPGKDCLLTPNVIDGHNVQITVAVECKKPNGRIHDLTITQVVAKSGEPFEVAVGEFNFSLTPNVTPE